MGAGGGGLGTSTNINKSNLGLLANDANQYNSGINESGLDIENEYGYATDEDSVFAEFFQKDEDKVIKRLGKKVGQNSDLGSVKKQVKQIIKRYTEQSKTYEFLVKFKVNVDATDNSSVASVMNASNIQDAAAIPSEVLEHKHKKKYLRNEARIFEGSRPFSRNFNEKLLLNYLIELVTKAGNLL